MSDTEYLDIGRPARTKRRRGLAAGLVAGAVVAVGLPLGGIALYGLVGGGGTQPHDVLPASAVGYLRLDLDPSGAEKIEAVRYLRSFPAFEKYSRITDDRADLREAIFVAAVDEADCDLRFDTDVKPWLGERFGVAMTPPAPGRQEPGVVAAVEVRDEQQADEGLRALRSCAGEGGGAGWTYLDGYMIVAQTMADAERAAEQASRSSLAETEQFRDDVERLGDQGVASLWFSGEAVHQAFGPVLTGDPGPAGAEFDRLRAEFAREIDSTLRSGAVAFRFDDRYAEVAAVVTGSSYEEPSGEAAAELDLPESTAVALGFAGGAEFLDRQWDTILDSVSDGLAGPPSGVHGDPEQGQVRVLERAIGLRLPADLQTLLGDTFTLALDGGDLDDLAALGGTDDLDRLDLGARVATDPAAFTSVVEKLERTAARNGVPFDLVVRHRDGVVVAALGESYAGSLATGGSLADSDAFRASVADTGAQGVLFVDVDVLHRAVLEAMGPAARQDELTQNLDEVQALGVAAGNHDGYAVATLRVTVGD